MTSAVGFTKPLVGGGHSVPQTMTASPMAEYVEIYKLRKSV
jgi:hypothetical protein